MDAKHIDEGFYPIALTQLMMVKSIISTAQLLNILSVSSFK